MPSVPLLPAEQVHLQLLERWRVAMNLVGPGPIVAHFEDAAGSVAGLDATGRWADLGTGAGFPGIALAVRHPDAEVLLVESRAKPVIFLDTVLADAELTNASVHRGRIEDLEPGFDGVISRAWKTPADYLAAARRLLVPGGRAVVLTGDSWTPPTGWRALEAKRYPVGDGTRMRTVVTPD